MHITKYIWPLIATNLCLGKNYLPNKTPPLLKSHWHHRYPTKGNHHGEPTWGHVHVTCIVRGENRFSGPISVLPFWRRLARSVAHQLLLYLDWIECSTSGKGRLQSRPRWKSERSRYHIFPSWFTDVKV